MQDPLRDQQLETYHREGYLTVDPFLATGQTFQLPGWVDEISRWPKAEGRWMHHHEMTDFGPSCRAARISYPITRAYVSC